MFNVDICCFLCRFKSEWSFAADQIGYLLMGANVVAGASGIAASYFVAKYGAMQTSMGFLCFLCCLNAFNCARYDWFIDNLFFVERFELC
jgi:hypothetical protein